MTILCETLLDVQMPITTCTQNGHVVREVLGGDCQGWSDCEHFPSTPNLTYLTTSP